MLYFLVLRNTQRIKHPNQPFGAKQPHQVILQGNNLQDAVYKTRKEKLNAIVEAVKEAHAKGQPVLVGTITIEASEELSKMLTRNGMITGILVGISITSMP